MNIGIVCYASVGGSGIIATELGKTLAARGHRIHLISSDTPFRLGEYQPGLSFHRVETPIYPLFREPQYLLSLANKIVQVSRDQRLDVVHAHYAIPHATAAYLARQILAKHGSGVPRVLTTLHGTDITLLGSDRSYSEIVAFCIQQSDGVSAVSESLKADTYRELGISADIRVIPNFLDCSVHLRRDATALRARLAAEGQKVIIHVSNFRPVKRVVAVVDVFARIRRQLPARLLMVGDGPDLEEASRQVRALGLAGDVQFLGEQDQVSPLLSASDVFLLPSAQESFGLAALEAMACEVPVVASRVGGLPEIIEDGVTGFVCPPDAVEMMAERGIDVLTNRDLRASITSAAAEMVRSRYCTDLIVPLYEAQYLAVMAAR